MLRISEAMQAELTAPAILGRVHVAFHESLPEFALQSQDDQGEFVLLAHSMANDCNIKSTMGIAAFGLAAWWLGPDLAGMSKDLGAALRSELPEIRKVHMLNEWAAARIAHPADKTVAERALVQAYADSRAWGEK